MAIYHDGHKKGEVVEGSVLQRLKEEYKSHRRPSPLESMMDTTPRKPWSIKKMLVGGILRQPSSIATATAAGVAAVLARGMEEDERLEVLEVVEDIEEYEEYIVEEPIDLTEFDDAYDDE